MYSGASFVRVYASFKAACSFELSAFAEGVGLDNAE